jgi:hypothetical protein
VPYSLEGLVRRELQEAGASLGQVQHGEAVEIAFTVRRMRPRHCAPG